MTEPNFETVQRARDYVLSKIGNAPRLAIVMGSGISASDELLSNVATVPYATIPGFPVPSVAGHRGQIVSGQCGRNAVLIFEGRVHYYEGWTMAETTFPIRVMGALGIEALLLTNAAGAVNVGFAAGQLMLITDHINCLGQNPLRGSNEARWGPRFPDMSEVYAMDLRDRMKASAARSGVRLCEGVYAAMLGPSYETPAEIRFLRTIGADAVGMSTVPEAIVARHMGLRVCGISMLSNMAAGITGQPLSHEEVLAAGKKMQGDLSVLIHDFIENYE